MSYCDLCRAFTPVLARCGEPVSSLPSAAPGIVLGIREGLSLTGGEVCGGLVCRVCRACQTCGRVVPAPAARPARRRVMPKPVIEPLLTISEMAALFGVTVQTVRIWADEGRLPGAVTRTLGGHRRFRVPVLADLCPAVMDRRPA